MSLITDARTHFDLELSLPHDVRLAEIVRQLAVQAAVYLGCDESSAEAFGRTVEEAARGCLADATAGHDVPVRLHRATGALEVRIDTRTLTLDV